MIKIIRTPTVVMGMTRLKYQDYSPTGEWNSYAADVILTSSPDLLTPDPSAKISIVAANQSARTKGTSLYQQVIDSVRPLSYTSSTNVV